MTRFVAAVSLMGLVTLRAASAAPQTASGGATPPQRLPGAPTTESFDLRIMHTGEKRALGDLQRVECLSNGTVRIHVKAAGETLVAQARKLTAIVLQTFRGEKEFSLGCGNRRPPDRVFMTYRPAPPPPPPPPPKPPARGGRAATPAKPPATPAIVGEAVALEFMPAGYAP